jgi:hypothetical protein
MVATNGGECNGGNGMGGNGMGGNEWVGNSGIECVAVEPDLFFLNTPSTHTTS